MSGGSDGLQLHCIAKTMSRHNTVAPSDTFCRPHPRRNSLPIRFNPKVRACSHHAARETLRLRALPPSDTLLAPSRCVCLQQCLPTTPSPVAASAGDDQSRLGSSDCEGVPCALRVLLDALEPALVAHLRSSNHLIDAKASPSSLLDHGQIGFSSRAILVSSGTQAAASISMLDESIRSVCISEPADCEGHAEERTNFPCFALRAPGFSRYRGCRCSRTR